MAGEKGEICVCCMRVHERRTVLKTVLGMGLGLLLRDVAAAQDTDPRNARPQEEDRFIFTAGERKGKAVTPEDLPLGGPPLTAYPLDPGTGVVRDGSRLNQVLLIRLDPVLLTAATHTHAAEGIVAYSAVCTHAGCDISDWREETKTLVCFCHYTEFDPSDGARVVSGPAPRRLAALPVKVINGVLMAAGGFVGRVGFQQG
jgi:Rieske Fe-S protein